MSIFSLPDRQIIYLLKYLRDYLNSNKYARNWMTTSENIVDGTIARKFYSLINAYKNDPKLEITRAPLPYLGLWRNKNIVNRRGIEMVNSIDAEFGWIAEIPGDMEDHDAETVGTTLASNIWHLCWEAFETIPLTVRQQAGVGSVRVKDCDFIINENEAICGFIGDVEIEQNKPPFAIDDVTDLTAVILEIKLYDSSGPTDLGLEVGATIDAS